MKRRYFRSLSWGYHAPGGAVLWWLVQPTFHLHILSELCFEQLDESELVTQINQRDQTLAIPKIVYTVGTPAIVSQVVKTDGFRGERIGDRLALYRLIIIAADDDLLNGWKRCLSLLRSDTDGQPWLTIDPSCESLIGAIPAGLRNDHNQDDLRTPPPSLTAFRYGAMSRPSPDRMMPRVHYPVGTPGYAMRQAMQRGSRRWDQRP